MLNNNKCKCNIKVTTQEEKKDEIKKSSPKKFRIGGRKENVCPGNETSACEIKRGRKHFKFLEKVWK